MYIISRQERNMLNSIMKYAKKDYYKKNNLLANITIDIDNFEFESHINTEEEVIKNENEMVKANNLEDLFSDIKTYNAIKTLKYSEKLLFFLFFVEEKHDAEISKILNLSIDAVRSRRKRILKKIREKLL